MRLSGRAVNCQIREEPQPQITQIGIGVGGGNHRNICSTSHSNYHYRIHRVKRLGTRPINGNLLIVAVGDEVVVVETNSLGGGRNATPGGVDLNPLINEQTFLAVMQNLRPYPQ
jgi:hypothetical protein